MSSVRVRYAYIVCISSVGRAKHIKKFKHPTCYLSLSAIEVHPSINIKWIILCRQLCADGWRHIKANEPLISDTKRKVVSIMRKAVKAHITNTEQEMVKRFNELCSSRQSWQVWSDFVTATACAIANSVDKTSEQFQQREDEYAQCIERLGGVELPSQMFAITTMQLEENPEQDYLGGLFMKLNLGNHWKGQFFTPYSVCEVMARVNVEGLQEKIENNGYVSINDCACGAGATLIAMANTLKDNGVNYQQNAVFVAQDVDRVAALMCYIQLSLLGCPGYVVVGNTLTNPTVGSVLNPIRQDGQEIWYTPMFATEVWHMRRVFDLLRF